MNKNRIVGIGVIFALVLVLIPIGDAGEVIVDKQLVDVEPKDERSMSLFIFCREINITSTHGIWIDNLPTRFLLWQSRGRVSVYIETWFGEIYQFTDIEMSGIMIRFRGRISGSPPYYLRGTALLCFINW